MSTNFEKRKAKDAETVKAEIAQKREDIRAKAANEPVYTQKGYDVFSGDGGRTFRVVELEYNPESGHARVLGTSAITRLIALKYDAQKTALGILKKGGR
jgi:hypothetical protein